MAKKTIGIDMGSNMIKIVIMDGKKKVASLIEPLPDHLVKDGVIASVEVMSEIIRDGLKKMGIKGGNTTILLSDSLSFVRTITVPVMNEEQLLYNIPFEFKDYINEELKDYVFDYAMVSDDKEIERRSNLMDDELANTMDVFVAACLKKTIEDMEYLCKKSNLKLQKVIPYVSGYVELIRSLHEGNKEYCIVDVGYEGVKVSIFASDVYKASRKIDIGLKEIDELIASKMNVDIHIAHTYVVNDFENCLKDEDVCNVYRSMAIELSRALNFYRFNYRQSHLQDVYICGGGSKNLSLVHVFSELLNDYQLHLANDLVHQNDEDAGILLPALASVIEG